MVVNFYGGTRDRAEEGRATFAAATPKGRILFYWRFFYLEKRFRGGRPLNSASYVPKWLELRDNTLASFCCCDGDCWYVHCCADDRATLLKLSFDVESSAHRGDALSLRRAKISAAPLDTDCCRWLVKRAETRPTLLHADRAATARMLARQATVSTASVSALHLVNAAHDVARPPACHLFSAILYVSVKVSALDRWAAASCGDLSP